MTPPVGALVASGLAESSMPNPNGSAVPITLVATPGVSPIKVKVGLATGAVPPNPNPNFPGLFFGFSVPFITPAGAVFPATTNLAALFQFAGVNIAPDGTLQLTFFWFVGGSFPETADEVIMGTRITDSAGVSSPMRFRKITIIPGISGQSLTPEP